MVRHAPVTGREGIIYGDDAPCDLETTTARLAELASLLPAPDRSLWCHSGVPRAYRTGLAVAAAKGATDCAMVKHEGFREQYIGDLIGCAHKDITSHLIYTSGKPYAPRPPGGESIRAFIQRVADAVKFIHIQALDSGADDIVVFCHGGTIRAAYAALNGLPVDDFILLDTSPLCLQRFTLAA